MKRQPNLKQLYPKGCAPPSGYVAWHQWAKAQGAHGLKQTRCEQCRRYLFPQELSGHVCRKEGGKEKGGRG